MTKPLIAAEKPTSSSRWALASLALSMLLPSLDTSIANVGLPTLAQALGASFHEVQWIVLAYLLAITTTIVSVGRLGDLVGRRRLMLLGIGLFTLASLLCGVAPTLWLLVAARALQGLGAAIMLALTVALVGETVPKARTGSAMGLLGTVSAVGTALGPSVGGLLVSGFGWRTMFLVNLPVGIVNLLLARRFLPADAPAAGSFDQLDSASSLRAPRAPASDAREPTGARSRLDPRGVVNLLRAGRSPVAVAPEPSVARSRFDPLGTALLALTLAAYSLAMTSGHGSFGPLNAGLLAGAAIGAGLFVAVEARVAAPLLRLELFRESALSASLAMSALVSTVVMATMVVGPFYLSRTLGLAPAAAGFALSVGPLFAALTGLPAGRLVDRLGARRMTLVGLAAMGTGTTVLAMLPASLGVAGYVAPLAVVTSGYALFQAANNTAIMKDVRADHRGVISGMLSLSRNLGLITGASFMGAVFALASASSEVTAAGPAAVATGMRTTFGVAAGLVALALGLAIRSQARRAASTEERPISKPPSSKGDLQFQHTVE